MWKKWTFAAIAYLFLVMVGYGIYTSVVETNANPSHQVDLNEKGH